MSLRTLAPGLMKRRRTTVILSVLASPVVFELLGGGQDSAFILAVWLIAMRLLASNQAILAGAVFGLGSAKPQLVIIVPLVLLATRSYRALSAFAAVSSLLLIASIGAVGFEGIQQWLAALSSPLYTEAVQQGQAWKMVSLPSFVQSFVPPGWQAWAVPVLTFLPLPLGAIFFLKQAIRNGKLSTTSTALWIAALATTLTFSPHLLSYDAILFVPVIMYLLENRPSAMLRVSTLASFAFLYFMPVLHLAAGHLPWPLAVIDAPWPALPLAYIWWQALLNLREESPSPISQAPDADVEAIPTTAKRVMF